MYIYVYIYIFKAIREKRRKQQQQPLLSDVRILLANRVNLDQKNTKHKYIYYVC